MTPFANIRQQPPLYISSCAAVLQMQLECLKLSLDRQQEACDCLWFRLLAPLLVWSLKTEKHQ